MPWYASLPASSPTVEKKALKKIPTGTKRQMIHGDSSRPLLDQVACTEPCMPSSRATALTAATSESLAPDSKSMSMLILSPKVCAGRIRTNVPTPGYNIQSLFRILPQHTVALRCAKSLELPQNGFLRGNQCSNHFLQAWVFDIALVRLKPLVWAYSLKLVLSTVYPGPTWWANASCTANISLGGPIKWSRLIDRPSISPHEPPTGQERRLVPQS